MTLLGYCLKCVLFYSIVYNTTTTSCDAKSGVFSTMNLLGVRNVDVLFGPNCSPSKSRGDNIAVFSEQTDLV